MPASPCLSPFSLSAVRLYADETESGESRLVSLGRTVGKRAGAARRKEYRTVDKRAGAEDKTKTTPANAGVVGGGHFRLAIPVTVTPSGSLIPRTP